MKYLLDTHTLLWWFHEPALLSGRVTDEIGNSEHDIFVSAVSAMEIATKHRKGRLEYQTTLAGQFEAEIAVEGFIPLSITSAHAERAGSYQAAHKDPWDRLLAAQTEFEDLSIMSIDAFFPSIGIPVFW